MPSKPDRTAGSMRRVPRRWTNRAITTATNVHCRGGWTAAASAASLTYDVTQLGKNAALAAATSQAQRLSAGGNRRA